MRKLIEDFLDFVYPRICAGCGGVLYREEELICLKCMVSIPKTDFKLGQSNAVSDLFRGKIPNPSGAALLYFKQHGLSREFIHQIKYKGNCELAFRLGEIYGEFLKRELSENMILCSVPLHPKKLKHRGYNQSSEIAKGISKVTGIPFKEGLLIRTKNNETQTKKRRFERWMNSEYSFAVGSTEKFDNQELIIVDDVLTTGSTMEACVHVSMQLGFSKVHLCPLCITMH